MMKEKLRKKFSKEPDKYYRVKLFDDLGFVRKRCSCGKFFWTLDEKRKKCPDPPCQDYEFIGNPIGKKMDYVGTWRAIEKFFMKNSHTSVPSYPVVCRWFPGLYFTIASIVAFQRSVAGKPVFEFPFNPLIVPQACLRFDDIPNVGISGRHYTSFVMIGQHCTSSVYWKDKCIELDYKLLTGVFKIKPEEIVFVEDVWIGPAAFGYTLEYFVRGLELGNAVFTEFLGTPNNYKIMDEKIIDMGAGLERFCWLTQGSPTSYDATFGPVIRKLKSLVDYDSKLFLKYARISGGFNLESLRIDEVKKKVAEKLGIDYNELKNKIEPIEAVYAICDHAKTLLYAITDGQLPSNVGGGYNLRIILRRALSFIDEFNLDIDLFDVCKTHSDYLKKLDPRLVKNLEGVKEILDIEKKRFEESRSRAMKTVSSILDRKIGLDNEKMIELYESYGITPELIAEIAKQKKILIEIPIEFYARISEKHISEKPPEEKIDISDLPKTRLLFYENENQREFTAKVLKVFDNSVVLNQTCFYGRSGGQEPDYGFLNGYRVYDVEKIGNVIVHKVENRFKVGDIVHGKIDWERSEQIRKHHTATHIINAAARKILGNHIWQSGAFKDVDKARLDITHYELPSDLQLDRIEKLANNIVKKNLKVRKIVLPRIEAEKKYGFRIYQGGAVPERDLRIIEIRNKIIDVEACGGKHCNSTSEVGEILLIKVERIQDGIVRLIFTAGDASKRQIEKEKEIIRNCSKILSIPEKDVVSATRKLFDKWKKLQKKLKQKVDLYAHRIAKDLEEKFVNNVLIEKIDDVDTRNLQAISKILSNENRVLILFGVSDKIYVFGSAGRNTKIDIGKIISGICEKLGGKGGGSQHLGHGIGFDKNTLPDLIEELKERLV